MNGKHIAAGTLRRRIGLAAASVACLAMVAGAGLYAAHIGGPVEAAAASRNDTAAVSSIEADGRMGRNREETAEQQAADVAARERAEVERKARQSDTECLYDGMSIAQAAQCEKRVAEHVRKQHEAEEAAKRAEEQRIAEEAARVKDEQEAAARKAAEEQAAREKEVEAARQAQAQAQAQRQAAAQQAQAAPAPAQNQAQAAPAPAPSVPVDHGIARTCNGNQPADCQWAIDQGGLVQVNFPDPWGMGTWIDFAIHNNEGGAWMLDVNVGDVIRIGGVDYRVKNRRTVVSGGSAMTTPIMMQTCDWTGGTAQLFDLERL